MNIFEVLTKQHREVEELFGDIQNAIASSQLELAHVMFQLLSIKVISGMRAEHAVVYPRFADSANLVDEVVEAQREHEVIEHAINRLRIGGLGVDEWCTGIVRLGTLIADHADLEQYILFPIARLALGDMRLRRLADDYQAYQPLAASVAGASITYDLHELTSGSARYDIVAHSGPEGTHTAHITSTPPRLPA